jgi:hypothetical protein
MLAAMVEIFIPLPLNGKKSINHLDYTSILQILDTSPYIYFIY